MEMFEYPVVFVDIETTGGSFRNSRVLEVAVVRYENGKVTQEFSSLINPEAYIPSTITSLTGIREADVIDAPVFATIAQDLMEIMDGAVFIAHNVRFDYSFLKHEFELLDMKFNPKLLCTVRLSRALYSGMKGHSLAVLIERHMIPVLDRHRALADAQAILYFSKVAFKEHGAELFNEAVAKQLKTQYMPPNLDIEELTSVGNVPGVYIFKDEANQPVYIGKSITLKKRILSHFQNISNKELKISQSTHHIETIPTGSELAALVLESKLIKEQQPLYNRMLRRVSNYAILMKDETEGYSTIRVKSGNVDDSTDLQKVYGLYESRTKAKHTLDELTRSFQLCPKLMGIEKTNGSCFSYSLGRCRGACIGLEDQASYNRRFETALEHNRIAVWPYDSPIAVPINEEGESVIINNWIIRGFLNAEGEQVIDSFEQNFDVDEYKITKRFIKENKQFIRTYEF
jgi:DNA polymerase-3 subunit epsilon